MVVASTGAGRKTIWDAAAGSGTHKFRYVLARNVTEPHILLTNDDGIDAPGLAALHDRLSERWDVTVVAPAEDQSGVGLTMNTDIRVERHERGYALHGTPADCVEVALGGLEVRPTLVVSGCNNGPNIGAHSLGRSGTVGAAMEAGLNGIPAIAVSLYDPDRPILYPPDDIEPDSFDEAVRVTEYLVERTTETDAFEHADYLNVVAPDRLAPMRITRPSDSFDIYTRASLEESLEKHDGDLTFRDVFWEGLLTGEVDEPGTDRHAIAEGATSVSPLRTMHRVDDTGPFETIAADYEV
jgi:5'-nucleotidase